LPEEVIRSTSVNLLKNRLDKFWTNQELMYDFKANLTGIENRSNLTSILKSVKYIDITKCTIGPRLQIEFLLPKLALIS
jgi:hypothetical protein